MAGSGASTQHGGYLMCRCISLPRGSPDMTCPPTSPRIEDANSHQPSGVSSVRGGGDTYHHHSLSPQSNGMGERAHRKIKDALCTCLAGAEWPLHLPWSSLASALLQKRTQQFHQPNWFMALHSLCLASSLPQRNGLQLTTSSSSSPQPLPLLSRPHMLRLWPQFQTNC
jgi:hypothetical protein